MLKKPSAFRDLQNQSIYPNLTRKNLQRSTKGLYSKVKDKKKNAPMFTLLHALIKIN